jgi:uncharacterized damage-inducible protein DinB
MDKQDFLEKVLSTRSAYEDALAMIPLDQMTDSPGPGQWTVKDVIAHVTWSEREMIGVLQARALIGSPYWNLAQDERNQAVYEENKDRPLDEVLVEARRVWHELWLLLEQLSDADLNDPSRVSDLPPGLSLWQILAGSTYIHYHEHAENLIKQYL